MNQPIGLYWGQPRIYRPRDATDKPFTCQHTNCNKSFYEKGKLHRHQRLKHGGVVRKAGDIQEWDNHDKTSEVSVPYGCQEEDLSMASTSALSESEDPTKISCATMDANVQSEPLGHV